MTMTRDLVPTTPGPERVAESHARLRTATTVDQLFVRAATFARTHLGFERVLVLLIEEGAVHGSASAVLEDPDSDCLRRRLLSDPQRIEPGTVEHALIRRAEGEERARAFNRSVLAELMGRPEVALGVIAPETRALAVIVAARGDDEVLSKGQQASVATLGTVVAAVFEGIVLRARVTELAEEIRSLTASARALIDETLHAPMAVPVDRGRGPTFPRVDAMSISCATLPADDFSDRERQIAALLVVGRSNQEIADELILSRETVKGYVRQILRKTGSSNRVEAVSRLLSARAAV
jgi:DNA-binding NarL/FixJ family response regulator